MLFNVKQAFMRLNQKKMFSAVMVLSFVLGFFPLSLGLAYGEKAIHLRESFNIKTYGQYVELDVDGSRHQGECYNSRLVENFIDEYSFVSEYTCVTNVKYNELSSSQSVYFHEVDASFDDFFNYQLLEGRFLYENDFASNPTTCIVEEGNAQNKIGDIVRIGKNEFTIVGVISSALFRSRILIPDSDYFDVYTVGFDVAVAGNRAEISKINWQQLSMIVSGNQTTESFTAKTAYYLDTLFLQVFIVCLVLFIYMLLNTYNILKNKAQEDARSFGIRLALGAKRKDIFRQFFMEVLTLMLIANAFLFAADAWVSPIIETVFEHKFGAITSSLLLIFCTISAYILSVATFRDIKNKQVVNLIEERTS